MLTVIPGMSYLKTLVPCAPMAPLTHTSDTSARGMRVPPDLHHATVLLVTVALGVAFGRRPLAHITPQRFSSGVRIHVSARLRQSTVRGAARLRSLHIFPLVVPSTPHDDAPPLPASTNTDTAPQNAVTAAEVCGTCVVGDHSFAFAARLQRRRVIEKSEWTMVALRIF